MLSEISQKEKGKYYMISLVESKKPELIETEEKDSCGWENRGDV